MLKGNKANQDWFREVAAAAGCSTGEVQKVLEQYGIRPSPNRSAPRALTITRLGFRGVKVGVDSSGPFKFDWPLGPGVWAVTSEANFRGKTSVLELARWMLRGRFTDKLEDVRSWLEECQACFALDGVNYEVRVSLGNDRLEGELTRSSTSLASFSGDDEFEAVMSEFFMRELGLDVLSVQVATARTPVSHGWPSLSGALFVGTDYSVLLGDVTPSAGIRAQLLHMFLGLPWVSTTAACKAAFRSAERARDEIAAAASALHDARAQRVAELNAASAEAKQRLNATPSDSAARMQLARASESLIQARQGEQRHAQQLGVAEREAQEAKLVRLEDQRALQTLTDTDAATGVFRTLEPSMCPRCETVIPQERRRAESETHSCSLCGEQIESEESRDDALIEARARLEASRQAEQVAKRSVAAVRLSVDEAAVLVREIEAEFADWSNKLTALGEYRSRAAEVASLEARLDEAKRQPPPRDGTPGPTDTELAVLKAAASAADARVKETQDSLLKKVSSELVAHARAFGMDNLNQAELKGNGNLLLEKGGKQTSYSKCQDGEKLRLKVATVLAMLSAGKDLGVGRHPGLLLIDSPGAQEVAPKDLDALVEGLVKACDGLPKLQVILAARRSEAIIENVVDDHRIDARGEAPVW